MTATIQSLLQSVISRIEGLTPTIDPQQRYRFWDDVESGARAAEDRMLAFGPDAEMSVITHGTDPDSTPLPWHFQLWVYYPLSPLTLRTFWRVCDDAHELYRLLDPSAANGCWADWFRVNQVNVKVVNDHYAIFLDLTIDQ